MSSDNGDLYRFRNVGRYGPGEVDQIKILREGLNKSLAELKAQDKISYCLAVKEIIGEMEKMRLQMTNRAVELSILSQQSNQLMETYNETLHQPMSRYATSISSFSAVLDRPARTLLDVSYRAHLNRHPLESEKCLSRIHEEPMSPTRDQFGSNVVSNIHLNGDNTNNWVYRAPGLLPTSRFHESIRVGSYPSYPPPIRKCNVPGLLRPDQDRREEIKSSFKPLPTMSKEHIFAPTLLSSVDPPSSRCNLNEVGVNDKVVFEVSTKKLPPSSKSSDLADAVSDCDSVEEVEEKEGEKDYIIDVHRRNSQSSETPKQKKSLEKSKLPPQRQRRKSTVAEFVLKKWSVALKNNDLLLMGKLCDKSGRVLDYNHKTSIVQTRKLDGSIRTKNGIYILVGSPVWNRPTDPPTPVKKLFGKKFPAYWRQTAKMWKLEQSKKKKASKLASKSPHLKNHSRKKIIELSTDDSDEEPTTAKQSKIKQEPLKSRKSKTNVAKNISEDGSSSASSDSDDPGKQSETIRRNPEPLMPQKTLKMTIKEIRKKRPSPSVEPKPPNRPKTQPAPSAANKPVKSPEIRKKKTAETKRAGAKLVEKDWQKREEYDLLDQLDLVVPKIGIPAMTPNTFCKALSKNDVRIGAHTPTLKTFGDEIPSVSFPDKPLPGPSKAKPKKDDVVAMRMAKAIESGSDPARGKGNKNEAGTFKTKNGAVRRAKTAVNANKEAIDEIIRMQKNKNGGATPKIIKKIREGRDDSDFEDETEIKSSETDSD